MGQLHQIPPRVVSGFRFKILDHPVPYLWCQVEGGADEFRLVADDPLFQGPGGYRRAWEDAHPDAYVGHGWLQTPQECQLLLDGLACL